VLLLALALNPGAETSTQRSAQPSLLVLNPVLSAGLVFSQKYRTGAFQVLLWRLSGRVPLVGLQYWPTLEPSFSQSSLSVVF
jgi:hypothetical protein